MKNKYKNVKPDPRFNKFGDGYKFDSKKEARRYQDLKLLQIAGEISALEVKPAPYSFDYQGKHICKYFPDFKYLDRGVMIIEDVKGKKTPVYKLKAKMMLAFYGIKVRET